MIIVKLMGGLGNQMFQYAVGRRLSLIHRADLRLDLSWFDNKAAVDTAREYFLGIFNVRASFASAEEIAAIADTSLFSRLGRLSSFVPRFLKRCYIREKHHHFDPAVLRMPNNAYLEGYWQSERYFTDIEDIIRQDFSFKRELNDTNKRLAEEIMRSESVSLHVRRGDYVANPVTHDYHGVCSREYYERAIEKISSRVNQPCFFVFSDDPDWVTGNMTWLTPMIVVNINGPGKGYEDMRLMSLCKHHIIANSSFSWWGAWLCPNPDKIVIAPRQWFKDPKINTNDVVPKTWIRI